MSTFVAVLVAATLCGPPPKDPFQAPEGPQPESSSAPAPAPTPDPSATPAPDPAAQNLMLSDEELDRLRARSKAGEGVAITGFVFCGLGLAALVLLAAPAAIAAEVAEDRTETNSEGFFSPSDEDLLARAERRRSFARTSALVGAGSLGGGLVFTGAGLGVWLPARREINDATRARMELSLTGVRGTF